MRSSRTSTLKVRLATTTVTGARVAYECVTTLVSASATTKYTLASTSEGSRVPVTSISTGRPSRETRLSTPAVLAQRSLDQALLGSVVEGRADRHVDPER
jgi:hypothetical protein